MATKKHYTEEFKRKVVDEYNNSNLTIEEVAAKYGIPPALLQDWVNKDKFNNIYISYVHAPVEKKNVWASVSGFGGVVYQKLKANAWLMAGCLPFIFAMFTFITCNRHVLENTENDNHNYTSVAIDSLTTVNNNLTEQIANIGVLLNKIDGKLNFNLSPTTIFYDYRMWNRYRRTNIKNVKNDNRKNTNISNVHDDDSTININQDSIMTQPSGHGKGCCCCYCCKRDTLKRDTLR